MALAEANAEYTTRSNHMLSEGATSRCYNPQSTSYKYVTLCTPDIVNCMMSQQKLLHIAALNIHISYFHNSEEHPSNQSSVMCELVLEIMPPNITLRSTERRKNLHVVNVSFIYQTCTRNNYVVLYFDKDHSESDYAHRRSMWTGCEPDFDPPSLSPERPNPFDVLKSTKRGGLRVIMVVNDVTKDHKVEMKVTKGKSLPYKRKLEVVSFSHQFGLIQTESYSPDTYNSSLLADKVFLVIPDNQSVLVSFRHMNIDCYENTVSLTVATREQENKLWSRCLTLPPLPEVFTGVQKIGLIVQMKRGKIRPCPWSGVGLRMIYSLLKQSSIPQKLSDNQWNCSTPTWTDLQPHLSCNLIAECDSAQDEALCRHEPCARGGFYVEGRCYLLGQPTEALTYHQARQKCVGRGGYLASFNTKSEMDAVMEVVWWNRRSRDVFVGLAVTSVHSHTIYRRTLQWDDQTIAYQPRVCVERVCLSSTGTQTIIPPVCGAMINQQNICVHITKSCTKGRFYYYLCEFDSASGSNRPDKQRQKPNQEEEQEPVTLTNMSDVNHAYFFPLRTTRCPDNHWIPAFLACDLQSDCWADNDVSSQPSDEALTALTSSWCMAPNTSESLYFLCSGNEARLPFTLVCDYSVDCFDGSDENFCVHPPCPFEKPLPCGDSGQCADESNKCNLLDPHCKNSPDTRLCKHYMKETPLSQLIRERERYGFPAEVRFHDNINVMGAVYIRMAPGSPTSPTHFECPFVAYRFPVFVRCNGVYDCPYKEDEAGCETYSCPGYFRCRQSRVCLHPFQVCDGRHQCPQHEDEWYCYMSCPDQCSCQGLAFTCRQVFPVDEFPDVRYLDVSGSEMKAESLLRNTMLVYLNMTRCCLTVLLLPQLPNVKILDVSKNQLKTVSLETLTNVSNLVHLILAKNPLTALFHSGSEEALKFPNLRIMDLSFVEIPNLDLNKFQPFSGLVVLNLSGSNTRTVTGKGYDNPLLAKLDHRGSEMLEFPHTLLKKLSKLRELHADSFKFCCIQALPDHVNTMNCHAPLPTFSTCNNLLGAKVQRIHIYLLTLFILLGNGLLCVKFFRQDKEKGSTTIFLSHLCVSKFLMGVYLSVQCVVDQTYGYFYLWKDTEWRSGAFCKLLAFIFLLSCEVTVFVDVSMVLHRCVVLTWMNKAGYQWKKRVTSIVCVLAWLAGACLSTVPTVSSDSEFSQTSLCVPLPVSGDQPGGHHYGFSLLVVLNGMMMVSTVVGQIYIYIMIRGNTLDFLARDNQEYDLSTGRCIIRISMGDVCSWCLVTLWAAVTSQEVWVHGEVNISVSIFFIFVSASITPYLYLLNGVLERRRQVLNQRVLKRLGFNLKDKL